MKKRIVCWRCGTAVKPDQLPITRLEQCLHCHAELHACRLCRYWNPRYNSKCSHDHAEPPLERERANFCQYFRPAPGAFLITGAAGDDTTRTELEALFGEDQEQTGAATTVDNMTETERARRALNELFSSGKGNGKPDST